MICSKGFSISPLLLLLSICVYAETVDEHLVEAVTRGDVGIISTLLKQGADVNYQNPGGSTPLFVATNKNKTDVVRLLLERGADPNIHPKQNSPLTRAVGRDTEIVRLLLAAGADPNFETGPTIHHTPLGLAASSRTETFATLKERGHYHGFFPNISETVKLLIAAGADIDHKDNWGRTPLRIAVGANSVDVVRVLLKAGADVHARNPSPKMRKYTGADDPIGFAAARGYPQVSLEIIELLLSAGADPNYRSFRYYNPDFDAKGRTSDGYTALTFAARWDLQPVVDVLLKYGADPCLPREDGASALAIAEKHNHQAVADLIRQRQNNKCNDF